jgi:hypothetical protein
LRPGRIVGPANDLARGIDAGRGTRTEVRERSQVHQETVWLPQGSLIGWERAIGRRRILASKSRRPRQVDGGLSRDGSRGVDAVGVGGRWTVAPPEHVRVGVQQREGGRALLGSRIALPAMAMASAHAALLGSGRGQAGDRLLPRTVQGQPRGQAAAGRQSPSRAGRPVAAAPSAPRPRTARGPGPAHSARAPRANAAGG